MTDEHIALLIWFGIIYIIVSIIEGLAKKIYSSLKKQRILFISFSYVANHGGNLSTGISNMVVIIPKTLPHDYFIKNADSFLKRNLFIEYLESLLNPLAIKKLGADTISIAIIHFTEKIL